MKNIIIGLFFGLSIISCTPEECPSTCGTICNAEFEYFDENGVAICWVEVINECSLNSKRIYVTYEEWGDLAEGVGYFSEPKTFCFPEENPW